MNYQIVDDFLSKKEYQIIMSSMESTKFPWYINRVLTTNDYTNEESEYNFQMCHGFLRNNYKSPHLIVIKPILEKINAKLWYKIKANLNPKTDRIITHGYHCDLHMSQFTTSVYYFNTNNGYTLFEDGTRVDSIANRMLTFDGTKRHTGTTCTDKKYRMVLNLNYLLV